MLSEGLVRFIRAHLGSVWALEVMLRMSAAPARDWAVDVLVRELRASDPLVAGVLDQFQRSGLTTKNADGTWRWQPATPELKRAADGLLEAHAVTPVAVIQAIVDAPRGRLSDFADAFRLRKD